MIDQILEVQFRTFKRIVFLVTWWSVHVEGRYRTLNNQEENGVPSVKFGQTLRALSGRFVTPEVCEQGYIYHVPGDASRIFYVKVEGHRRD